MSVETASSPIGLPTIIQLLSPLVGSDFTLFLFAYLFILGAPLLFLWLGPGILRWRFSWWGWLAGTVVGLGLFLTAIVLLINSYREACHVDRGDETACELGTFVYPVLIGWYLLVLILLLPRIAKTFNSKSQNRTA